MVTKDIKSIDVHTEDIKAPQKSKAVKKGKKKGKKTGPKKPWKMTPATIDKLKAAFAYDMTDEEACWYAEISTDALYKYQRENPEFINTKQALKARPIMKAREEFIKKLSSRKVKMLDKNGEVVEIVIPPDSKDLKWWLEKKRKDEFGKEIKMVHDGEVEVKGIKEYAEMIQQVIRRKKHDGPTTTGSDSNTDSNVLQEQEG